MTVAENVAYGLKIRKLDKATIDGQAESDPVDGAARGPGGPLSRRTLGRPAAERVACPRAVVEPETLLLDEPLDNLDANLREEMRFEIRRLHDRYRYTTVYVTHDQAEAITTADLIAVMNHGKVEQLGPPEEIYSRPRSEFVARFIGGANILRGAALDQARVSVAGAPAHDGAALMAGKPVRCRCASTRSARRGEAAIGDR